MEKIYVYGFKKLQKNESTLEDCAHQHLFSICLGDIPLDVSDP
jgi:hypothetical protein